MPRHVLISKPQQRNSHSPLPTRSAPLFSPSQLHDSSDWFGQWTEGTPATQYQKSLLTLTAKRKIIWRDAQTVVIDGFNGIRPNCGMPAKHTNFTIWTNAANATVKMRDRHRVNFTGKSQRLYFRNNPHVSFLTPSPLPAIFVACSCLRHLLPQIRSTLLAI